MWLEYKIIADSKNWHSDFYFCLFSSLYSFFSFSVSPSFYPSLVFIYSSYGYHNEITSILKNSLGKYRWNINWICCLCFGLSTFPLVFHILSDSSNLLFLSLSLSLYIYIYVYIYIYIYKSKLANHRRGWPKGSFFNSYYTKM